MLDGAKKYWTNLDDEKKNDFICHHISTDEIYGDLPHPDYDCFNDPNSLPLFKESSNYDPSSPYSASKAASDHLVRACYRTYKLPTIA